MTTRTRIRRRAKTRRRIRTRRTRKSRNKTSVRLPEEVLWSDFADAAFAELAPHTGGSWPSDLEEFNKTPQGEFSGVGIQTQNDEDASIRVVSPPEASPAYKAGIKA